MPPLCKYNCKKASIKSVSSQDNARNSTKGSATGKLCETITNILKGEVATTKNKTKLGLLKDGLKYAEEACGGGDAPDLAEITKDLPEEDRLRISQKTSAALFDGTGELPTGSFSAASAKPSTTLTGKSGRVLDLKSSDPDINKTSPKTEFSLQNKPAALPASAKITLFPQKAYAVSPAATPDAKSSPDDDFIVPPVPCPRPGNCDVTVYPDPGSKDPQADCNRKYAEICPSGDSGFLAKLKKLPGVCWNALKSARRSC